MAQVQQSSLSVTSKLKQAVGTKDKAALAGSPALQSRVSLGNEPQLSAYVVTRALKRPEVGHTHAITVQQDIPA